MQRPFVNLLGLVQAACARASHGRGYVPFFVEEQEVGWLQPPFARDLQRWPQVFEVRSSGVNFRPKLDTPAGRSDALDQVTRALAREGGITGWREEAISISADYAAPELFRVERAAARRFGLMSYAAHLNGFTLRDGHVHTWIGRRAPNKSVDPGMLDNLVGGRIASGYTVDQTIHKEAWEEAGIPRQLMEGVRCVGAVHVEYNVSEGLHRETIFVHDLWLPPHFTPANQDGEVSDIRSMPVDELTDRLLRGEFTLDAGAVMVEALLRVGVSGKRIPLPEDAQYLEILRLLKP